MAPGTGLTLYKLYSEFLHATVFPLIAPGVGDKPLTLTQDAGLLPHGLFATTQILPKLNPALKTTLIDVVPCPLCIVEPDGTVQV